MPPLTVVMPWTVTAPVTLPASGSLLSLIVSVPFVSTVTPPVTVWPLRSSVMSFSAGMVISPVTGPSSVTVAGLVRPLM